MLRDQADSKTNFQKTCETYEKKLKYSIEKNSKFDQNLILLKNENNNLKAAVENFKINIKNLENNVIEKDIEINKNENIFKDQINRIDDLKILKVENNKLKEFLESSKNENFSLDEKIQILKIELEKNEEKKIILELNCNENKKLLIESKRNFEEKIESLVLLEKRKEEENLLKDDKFQFLITKMEQKHKFEKENLNRLQQQENLTIKNDFNQIIFSLKQDSENEILKTSRITIDEIEKIKTLHATQFHKFEILKNNEINQIRTESENRFLNFQNQYDNHVSALKEKLDKLEEKEKIEKKRSIELMQEIIIKVKSDMTEKFNLEKNNTDIELINVKNKLRLTEENLVNCQIEKDKKLDITTKYCNEKLFSEYEELLKALDMLENKFKIAQNEIQESVFLINEFSKNFILCCDAMNRFDDELSVLVEGNRTGESVKSKFNDNAARQIVEDLLVSRKLEMNEGWTGRDDNRANRSQTDFGSTLRTHSLSPFPSFYTPSKRNNSDYQSTSLGYQNITNNEGTFVLYIQILLFSQFFAILN